MALIPRPSSYSPFLLRNPSLPLVRTHVFRSPVKSMTRVNSTFFTTKKRTFTAAAASATPPPPPPPPPVGNAADLNYGRIAFSDVVVRRRRRNAYWGRKWSAQDLCKVAVFVMARLLCLAAPFTFNWAAFWVAVAIDVVAGLLGSTLCYHRCLTHRRRSKTGWQLTWWFSDLEEQPFYKFIQKTYLLHPTALAVLLYAIGGMPFIVWSMGVRVVYSLHRTFLVNSVCHIWGKQPRNTGDLSRNNWLIGLLAFGEGWHNNHHAFEFSARHGLEWWQIDTTWYVIKFLETVGLATDVKLPTDSQKRKMALGGERSQ